MRIALLLALAPVVQCPLSKTEPCFVGIPAPKAWTEPKLRVDPCGGNPHCRDGYWVPPVPPGEHTLRAWPCDGSTYAKLKGYECSTTQGDPEDYKPHYAVDGNCSGAAMIEKYGKAYACDVPPETTCKLTETLNDYRVEATNGTCTFEMRKSIEFPYFGNKAITARP